MHVVSDVQVVWLRRLLPAPLPRSGARGCPDLHPSPPGQRPRVRRARPVWSPSLIRTVRFLVRQRPAILLLGRERRPHCTRTSSWRGSPLGWARRSWSNSMRFRIRGRPRCRFSPSICCDSVRTCSHAQAESSPFRRRSSRHRMGDDSARACEQERHESPHVPGENRDLGLPRILNLTGIRPPPSRPAERRSTPGRCTCAMWPPSTTRAGGSPDAGGRGT